jgi:hypothetical protein
MAPTRQQEDTPTSPGTWQSFVSPSSGPTGNAIDCFAGGTVVADMPSTYDRRSRNVPISERTVKEYELPVSSTLHR